MSEKGWREDGSYCGESCPRCGETDRHYHLYDQRVTNAVTGEVRDVEDMRMGLGDDRAVMDGGAK